MKNKEISDRINAHLKRFEADPVINARDDKYGTAKFYYAGSYYHAGPKIRVTYVSYQGSTMMSKAEATEYLEWLDAGNVGTHYTMQYASKS